MIFGLYVEKQKKMSMSSVFVFPEVNSIFVWPQPLNIYDQLYQNEPHNRNVHWHQKLQVEWMVKENGGQSLEKLKANQLLGGFVGSREVAVVGIELYYLWTVLPQNAPTSKVLPPKCSHCNLGAAGGI